MSHISANNIDRKLMRVYMSMVSRSMNPNMAIRSSQLLFFNMDATSYVLLLHNLHTAARNNATCICLTLQFYLISVSSNDIALVEMRLVNLLAYQLY